MNFDPEDTPLTVIVAFSAAVMTGTATFELFGVSLSDTIEVFGTSTSVAWAIVIGSVGVTIATNDLPTNPSDLKQKAENQLDQEYYAALLLSGGLLLTWPFVPQVADFVTSADLWSLLYILVVTGGQVAMGWIN